MSTLVELDRYLATASEHGVEQMHMKEEEHELLPGLLCHIDEEIVEIKQELTEEHDAEQFHLLREYLHHSHSTSTPSLIYSDDWIHDFIPEDFLPYLMLEQLPNEHREEIRRVWFDFEEGEIVPEGNGHFCTPTPYSRQRPRREHRVYHADLERQHFSTYSPFQTCYLRPHSYLACLRSYPY